MLSPIRAQASHPASTTVEQHWELLAEAADGLSSSTSYEIERGALPGGTTRFSPAPTATFEVAGRYSGGGSATWQVKLISDSATLASVSFTNADTTLARRSASFTWPSADTELDQVTVTKTGSGGAFDLRKASIAIRQSGVITKTVARVPIATKQFRWGQCARG